MKKTFGHQPPPAKKKSGKGKRYVTYKDLPEMGIFYCASHLRRMYNEGRFPRPQHLSPRKLVWNAETVEAWREAKLAEDDA